MPSIMSAIAQDYNIVSPFWWDALLVLLVAPGINLKLSQDLNSLPGDDSIRAMKECSIAMTVTKGDYNPADRKLYQFLIPN